MPLSEDLWESVHYIAFVCEYILLASSDLGMFHETKTFLSKHFEMKDMGDASYVLGIEITRDRPSGTLGLSQKAYISKILERFNMQSCSPDKAPIL